MKKNGSFQIVCPQCHHEFRYDMRYYSDNIAKLNREISEMRQQLTDYKDFSPKKKREWSNWRKQLLSRYEQKLEELRELKEYKKMFNIQVNNEIELAFRRLVKQRIGEEEYIKLREEAAKFFLMFANADCEKIAIEISARTALSTAQTGTAPKTKMSQLIFAFLRSIPSSMEATPKLFIPHAKSVGAHIRLPCPYPSAFITARRFFFSTFLIFSLMFKTFSSK